MTILRQGVTLHASYTHRPSTSSVNIWPDEHYTTASGDISKYHRSLAANRHAWALNIAPEGFMAYIRDLDSSLGRWRLKVNSFMKSDSLPLQKVSQLTKEVEIRSTTGFNWDA